MESKVLQNNLLELIRRTSAELPDDVVRVIEKGWRREETGSNAKYALKVVLDNIKLPKKKSQPLCQDTGTIICYAELPAWLPQAKFERAFEAAVVQATEVGYLRQNSVDSLTGKNSGNNLGPGSPSFHCVVPCLRKLTATDAVRLSSPSMYHSNPAHWRVGGSTMNLPAETAFSEKAAGA